MRKAVAAVCVGLLGAASCGDGARGWEAGEPAASVVLSALTNPGCSNDAASLVCQFGAPSATNYRIYLDTDRNAATGFPMGQGIGVDYLVEAYSSGFTQIYRDHPDAGWRWEPLGPVAFSYAGGVAQFTIPRATLGETAACGETTDAVFNHDATYSNKVTHTYAPACGGGGISLSNWRATNSASQVSYQFQYSGAPGFFHVWLDTDRNIATGYPVGGVIGADYLLEADGTGYSRLYRDRPAAGWGWDDLGAAAFSAAAGSAQWTIDRSSIGETACPETAELMFDVQSGGTRVASPKVAYSYAGSCSDGGPVVLVGAGDIASDNLSQYATAALLNQVVAASAGVGVTVMAIGDLAYPNASAADFAAFYHPAWGVHKSRTRPALGNHEYVTPGAAGYFGYWGAAGGEPGKGYYSYDHGAWHVVVINSNCWEVGGCDPASSQVQWLRADLAAHPAPCTLAYWHHPFVSSGFHHQNITHDPNYAAIWQALQDNGADVVVSAHDHDYERLAPIRADLAIDTARGIRSFIVGTGNSSQRPFFTVKPSSQVRSTGVQGVLKLTLRASDYDWAFIPIAGQTFSDSGTAQCH